MLKLAQGLTELKTKGELLKNTEIIKNGGDVKIGEMFL